MIRFKEVYQSKHGKVRIYKILSVSNESKEWVPKNRLCDAPGSWFCPGQYPPGLQKVLKEKKDFRQVSFEFDLERSLAIILVDDISLMLWVVLW